MRLEWSTDDNDNQISDEVETDNPITGHLQQATPEQVNNLANVFTLSHLFWCASTSDVEVGDVLIIDEERYGVRAIQDNSFIGRNKHLELHLEKYTSTADESGS